jgi:hypothetical protein
VAKSSKDRDRRAVVEQMRREQQSAEKKRTYTIIAGCVLVGLVIVAAGAYPLIKDAQEQSAFSGKELGEIGVALDAAGCQDVQSDAATGSADHRPESEQLSYEEAPPASGPHYPTWAPMSRKFYTAQDRPELGYLVHNLEHGYNILWYDETVAGNDKQLAEVKAMANSFSGSDFENKFIAAPWTGDDGDVFPGGTHIALTHWSMGGTNGNEDGQRGVVQYCAAPSGEAVAQFVEDYPYTDSPEPNAS